MWSRAGASLRKAHVSAATVKHLDPTQVELEISISNEELDAARERAFRELVKNVRIPGFRARQSAA